MIKDVTNFGFCQGIIKGTVYSPNDSVAMINLLVRSNRKNPKTKKREISLLNFSARGENAKKLQELCHDGDIAMVSFHLEEKLHIEKKNGVSNPVQEMVIDDIIIRGPASDGKQPYLNKGFIQGAFLGIYRIPGAEGISVVNVLRNDLEKGVKQHHRFFVYGAFGEQIERSFEKGRPTLVEYKIEKSKHVPENGKAEYFTNCVIEQIS